uniref:Uncharacterized protein n=1 Tax=Chryseobacterium endophyticum TaxID=1854762 RepID=A0AAU6WLT3_9FLAO
MPVILGENIKNFNVKDTLGLLNNDKEINKLKIELEQAIKEKNIKIIMGNELNFTYPKFGDNNQIGTDRSIQNNYINSYKNSGEIEKIKELSNELKEYIDNNEEWKKIFSDGFNDLIELQNSNSSNEEMAAKSKLKTFYNGAKKIVDWKNIAILPVEIHEKGPKLLELLHNIVS